jgi:dTDP-4-dehydrorhamnose 3,5-epimerase
VIVSAEERNLVFVPAGCAHGYQALEDDTEVSYQVSHPYVPGAERGIRWNDPEIGIDWPITDGVIVSAKDAAWPDARLEVPR